MDIFKCALQFIYKNNDVLISDELIIELHNIITDGTLEDVNISERYKNDTVILKNIGHEIVYEAPNHKLVQGLMTQLINYITCDSCNLEIDRDLNASINIREAGKNLLAY